MAVPSNQRMVAAPGTPPHPLPTPNSEEPYDPDEREPNLFDCALAAVTAAKMTNFLRRREKSISDYKAVTMNHVDASVWICKSDGSMKECVIANVSVSVTLLDAQRRSHIYQDVFTVQSPGDIASNKLPCISNASDSVAPIVMERGGSLVLVGMVVGGHETKPRDGNALSVIQPVDRIFRRLGLRLYRGTT